MTIPDAKPQIVKRWEKLEMLPSWQVSKVKSRKEVIEKAQKEGRVVLVYAYGRMPPQEFGDEATVPKNTNVVLCSVLVL